MSTFLEGLRPFARETLTVSNTVKTLTASVYNDATGTGAGFNQIGNKARHARGAIVTVDGTNAIRFTQDGTDPVAGTTGEVMNPNDQLPLEGLGSITKLKMIREGSSDATVQVEYYR